MSKLKTLNKETVSFVLLNDLNLPDEVIGEIVEIIWRSDERLEEIQRANTRLQADLAVRGPACDECGGVVFHAKSCSRVTRQAAKA